MSSTLLAVTAGGSRASMRSLITMFAKTEMGSEFKRKIMESEFKRKIMESVAHARATREI